MEIDVRRQGVPPAPRTSHNGARDMATLSIPTARPPVIRSPGRRAGRATDAPDTVSPLEDAALVERSRVDAEAFGVLYDRYCDQIYRFVHRRLNDREAAQDVTGEVFFKALKAIDTFRPATAPFSAWLYRIAANAVIDHLRARRVTTTLDAAPDPVDRVAPVDEQAINRVEAARVWEAIDALGDAQRTAVTLRFGDDLPIARIAERMGRSEGAVKLLLNRALVAVRGRLGADEGREGQP